MGNYQEDIVQSTDDAANVGINFNSNAESYLIASPTLAAICGFRFQDVPIDQAAVILSATLRLRGTQRCSVGACRVEVWGVDEDDVITWQPLGVNEPKDATKTTASTEYETSDDLTPDHTFKTTSLDVTAQVQEIIDRAGWSNNNNIAFVTNDNGSSGRGANITIHTFDTTASIPMPDLVIEWISDETIGVNTVTITGAALTMTVAPGAVSVEVDRLEKNIMALGAAYFGGATAVTANTIEAELTAMQITPSPGPVALQMKLRRLYIQYASLNPLPPMSVIPGPVDVAVNAAAMNVTALALAIAPGAVTIEQAVTALTITPQPVVVVMAGETILMNTMAMNLIAQDAAIIPGAVTVPNDALALTITAEDLSLIPGAVNLEAGAVELLLEARQIVFSTGAAAALMDLLHLSLTPQDTTVLPGAMAIQANQVTLTAEALTLVVTPGASSISAAVATLTLMAQTLEVISVIYVQMQAATMEITPQVVSLIPGSTTVNANTPALVLNAEAVSYVGGAVAIGVSAVNLVIDAETGAVVPGLAGVNVDVAQLFLTPQSASIETAGAAAALMNLATLTIQAQNAAPVPGEVIISADRLPLILSVGDIAITPGATSVPFNPVPLVLTAEQMQMAPGGITVAVDGLALSIETGKFVLYSSVIIGVDPAVLNLSPGEVIVSAGAVTVQLQGAELQIEAHSVEVYTVTFPDGRMLIVSRETRELIIRYDDRRYTIVGDGRVLAILTEDRTWLLDPESQTFAIVGTERIISVTTKGEPIKVNIDTRGVATQDSRTIDVHEEERTAEIDDENETTTPRPE